MPEIKLTTNPNAVTRIADLLHQCSFEDVERKIRLHYGARELDKYRTLYENLCRTTSTVSENELYIFITVFMEDEEEDIRVDEFDEDDDELTFDVSAFSPEKETVYSIASAPWEEFLQFGVSPVTLRSFSPESILAHCLYELSCYGFENRK